LVVVLVKNSDDGSNVDRVKRFDGDGEVTGTAVELTHMNLLFSGIALMAGAAIWNKSPRSVMADQTMKKALIKRADTRLFAC
jgi:hypothetical protein